jgi:hypothetical protein
MGKANETTKKNQEHECDVQIGIDSQRHYTNRKRLTNRSGGDIFGAPLRGR